MTVPVNLFVTLTSKEEWFFLPQNSIKLFSFEWEKKIHPADFPKLAFGQKQMKENNNQKILMAGIRRESMQIWPFVTSPNYLLHRIANAWQ